MSKIILKVGYTDILLPDDRNLAAILKALGRGLVCDDLSYGDRGKIVIRGELILEMKVLPRAVPIVAKAAEEPAQPLALPQPEAILL